MAGQWHFSPETYLEMVRSEIDGYDALQQRLAACTAVGEVRAVLDLGSGIGVTARAVLDAQPAAVDLVGIDESAEMLAHAAALVPEGRFVVRPLEDGLPPGPFDVVVSAFAIHHLDGPGKADLFVRIADVLRPAGRFVLLDVVVPTEPVETPVPLEDGVDQPSTLAELQGWLAAAGLAPAVVWAERDLALLTADRTAAA